MRRHVSVRAPTSGRARTAANAPVSVQSDYRTSSRAAKEITNSSVDKDKTTVATVTAILIKVVLTADLILTSQILLFLFAAACTGGTLNSVTCSCDCPGLLAGPVCTFCDGMHASY